MEDLRLRQTMVGVLLLLATAAYADEQPQQKPGLWQRISQTTEEGKTGAPEKSQSCVDAATLAMVKEMAKRCSKHDVRKVGGKWIEDSVCNLGTTTLTVHGETRMNGENGYHTESDSTYVPALHGGGHSRTVTDGVWLGPCKGKS